mmetsp:Transcript_33930/g.85791  ORF Transcript_33930/g.85791 Transcript_33930/m.85791 type:complete len:106 (-) Transcript_33930:922-1239(-)
MLAYALSLCVCVCVYEHDQRQSVHHKGLTSMQRPPGLRPGATPQSRRPKEQCREHGQQQGVCYKRRSFLMSLNCSGISIRALMAKTGSGVCPAGHFFIVSLKGTN